MVARFGGAVNRTGFPYLALSVHNIRKARKTLGLPGNLMLEQNIRSDI